MNYATALVLPSWTTEVQDIINKTAFYTPIVWKAFNKTLAPVIIFSAKGLAAHWFETERLWRERITGLAGITYNPLTASVSAAYSELTSDNAIATYNRIRHITREATTDALVIGLCGVVAIASGVELAQKVYRTAKRVYAWLDAKLNPAEPGPVILPTVEMALTFQQDHTEVLGDLQVLTAEDQEYERQFMARLERLDADALATAQVEEAIAQAEVYHPNRVSAYIPVVAEIVNPEPHDIHQEVEDRLREIHSVPLDAPAEDIAQSLNVPGAKGTPKRTTKDKPPTSKGTTTASARKKGVTAKKRTRA